MHGFKFGTRRGVFLVHSLYTEHQLWTAWTPLAGNVQLFYSDQFSDC